MYGYLSVGMLVILEKIGINKTKRKILCILLLIFFMFLTGFTPSVVRACLMVILVQLSFIFQKKADLISTISFSLLVILIENPFKIQNLGLQLSYMRNNWYYSFLSNNKKRISIIFTKIKKKIFKTNRNYTNIFRHYKK